MNKSDILAIRREIAMYTEIDPTKSKDLEERLYYDFIKFVADSNDMKFSKLAILVLSTQDVIF